MSKKYAFCTKKRLDGFGAFSSPLHAQSTWNDDAMGRGLTPGISEGEVVVRVVLSLRRSRIFAFVYLHSSKKMLENSPLLRRHQY